MIADLGLSEEVGHSALSYLDNTRFANEVVEAATRVNYGQDIDSIHALGALVSMAGSNGMVGDLYSKHTITSQRSLVSRRRKLACVSEISRRI